MKTMHLLLCVIVMACCSTFGFNRDAELDALNVIWPEPGGGELASMPLGNGETALNVWVEENGDLEFYISRTDAWAEDDDGEGNYALVKLAKIRVSMDSPPGTGVFSQELKLRRGEMLITYADGSSYLIWVDANNQVIHVEVNCTSNKSIKVEHDFLREVNVPDVILDRTSENKIMWYHRNPSGTADYIKNRTFGALIKGPGLTSMDTKTLVSAPGTNHRVDIYPLTTTSVTASTWESNLKEEAARLGALDYASTYAEHLDWWQNFWDRSYIHVRGNADAELVNMGYNISRFQLACQGRGAYPIKFNGGLFNVAGQIGYNGNNSTEVFDSADKRGWGGNYWWQNTRHMYWPLTLSGDYDMMYPLFDMYKNTIMANRAVVQSRWGHNGSIFYESWPIYPGLPDRMDDNDSPYWHSHTWAPILEFGSMMWDFYIHTDDQTFAENYLVPIMREAFTFYNEHFDKVDGMLEINPGNAAEMHWKVIDPVTDLAGLHYMLPRMLSLPESLVSAQDKAMWQSLLDSVKPVPISNGKIIDFYGTNSDSLLDQNAENPELYAVYPFKLFGTIPGNNDIANATFDARDFQRYTCWHQDGIQAALIGNTAQAKRQVTKQFGFKAPELKFPTFFENYHDYSPDQDGLGNALQTLQAMLVQYDDEKILLAGAWPSEWSADFKLRAPYNTVIEGTIINGTISNLVVTPASRIRDILNEGIGDIPETYSLNILNGSGDGNYTAGTVVNISADAAPAGQVFHSWTGDVAAVADVNSANTTVTMPAAVVTLTATYTNGSSTTHTFNPTDDAYLQDTSCFNDSTLKVESGYRVSYLKFNVNGLAGPVERAEIVLQEGGDPGDGTLRFYAGSHNNWTETNLSTANAPAAAVEVGSWNGSVSSGQAISVDVTPLVSDNGEVSLIIMMDNGGNDIWFSSSEGAVSPQLIVETGFTPPPEFELTVNSGSGDGTYTEGTVVNISADAAPAGWVFNIWTGDVAAVADVNLANTTVIMPSNAVTITATYNAAATATIFQDDFEDDTPLDTTNAGLGIHPDIDGAGEDTADVGAGYANLFGDYEIRTNPEINGNTSSQVLFMNQIGTGVQDPQYVDGLFGGSYPIDGMEVGFDFYNTSLYGTDLSDDDSVRLYLVGTDNAAVNAEIRLDRDGPFFIDGNAVNSASPVTNAWQRFSGTYVATATLGVYDLAWTLENLETSTSVSGTHSVNLNDGNWSANLLDFTMANGIRLYVFDKKNNEDYHAYFDNVRVSARVPLMDPYDTWAVAYGGSGVIGSYTNDFDGDGIVNLVEYALGGNPTNEWYVGEKPELLNAGGVWVYIHARRSDDASLVYTVESCTNLVSGVWTNAGYVASGTNVTGGLLDYVTNSVSIDQEQTYIRLKVIR